MTRAVVAFASLLIASTTRAGTELPVELRTDFPAAIRVVSCFENLPPAGYAPIEIRITNSSDRPLSWDFDFESPAYSYGDMVINHSRTLSVQPKSARAFQLIVPLAVRELDSYSAPLVVNVAGPGTTNASVAVFSTVNRTGKPVTSFVAISESLGAKIGSQLEDEIKKGNQQLASTKFRPAELPEDWRTLVGIAGMWMSDAELSQLSPAQRGAIDDWIRRGGALFVAGRADADAPANAFGRIIALPSAELDVTATADAIRALAPSLAAHLTLDYARGSTHDWGARNFVGAVGVNVPLLIALMGIFAAAVGPFNLFVLAPHGRRHRLFWTTPAISVGASVVLFALIVLQDGFGGWGLRTAIVHIDPTARKQVVLQEQLARTGVVGGSSFETAEPTFIAPITLEPGVGPRKQRYENTERSFAGEWFTSRTLQGHWLESIASTRAEVVLLNPGELRDPNVPPVVLSSIGAQLESFFYFDEHGGTWRADNVRAGERVSLTRAAEPPELLPEQAGLRLRDAFGTHWRQPGYFYAKTTDRADLINTLASIRWQNQQVIYLGPVSTTPAP